jgi:hypothetical protein
MTVSDYLVSLVRTFVPVVVGYLLSVLTGLGIDVDPTAAETIISGLFIGGYYALARALEKAQPWFGVLLGWKATPTYVKAD